MAANKEEGIADEVLDQLLEGRDPATVFETGGLVDELKKRLAERMLNAEMDHHLGTAYNNRLARDGRSPFTPMT
jgi:putative transposase